MLKVGLTGGIGCGKSTVVNAFRVLGVSIIDADQISKALVAAKSPALREISDLFGEEILLDNGELNRAKLKQIIFNDSQALDKLEKIIHPKVRQEIKRLIAELSKTSIPYVVVDIPLLLEKNYKKMFERIVVVDCTMQQQIKRVAQRDQLDESAIQLIIDKQIDRKSRLKQATDILDNSGDIRSLKAQVEQLHIKLLKLAEEGTVKE